MRRALLVVALALAGCDANPPEAATGSTSGGSGSTGGSSSGSTGGSGSTGAGGLPFAPTRVSAHRSGPDGGPANTLWVTLSDPTGGCAGSAFPDHALSLWIISPDGGEVGPGTYPVGGARAGVFYDEPGPGGLVERTGVAGSVTVTSLGGAGLVGTRGSFEATAALPDGGEALPLAATFETGCAD